MVFMSYLNTANKQASSFRSYGGTNDSIAPKPASAHRAANARHASSPSRASSRAAFSAAARAADARSRSSRHRGRRAPSSR